MTKFLASVLFVALGTQPPGEVADLIRKLGDDNFAVRKDAARALEQLGSKALPALRQATQFPELEVRQRCQHLVEKIETRLLTEQLLTPRRVNLTLEELTFKSALRLFSEEGISAQLAPKGVWQPPLISLQTGDVPLWRAWKMLCEAGGLVETAAAVEGPHAQGPIVLHEKGPATALDVSGPLRFRVLPAKAPADATFFLEARTDGLIGWEVPLSVRIDRALDDDGHYWKHARPWSASEHFWNSEEHRFAAGPRNSSVAFLLPVHLEGPAVRPGLLKQLRGSVAFKVQAEQTLLDIDPTRNLGHLHTSDAGVQLKVISVQTRQGKLEVRFELRNLAALPISGAEPRIVRVRPGFVAQRGLSDIALDRMYLLDSRGKKLVRASLEQQSLPVVGGGAECRAVFEASEMDGPLRLRLCVLRILTVDVPFALNDVRLP